MSEALILAQKLRDDADRMLKKIRGEREYVEHVPGYIRLKYAAADELERLACEAHRADELALQTAAAVNELKGYKEKLDMAVGDLAIMSDCCTCKNAPATTCPKRGECGRERKSWSWRGQ